VQLLIPAKIPQCPAHMCGALCTHLAARLTPPLAMSVWCFKHSYMFVSQQQHREETEKEQPRVHCSDSLAGLQVNNILSAIWTQRTCEEMNLGQAQRLDWLRHLEKQKRHTSPSNHEAEIWGPLCRNEDNLLWGFFFSTFPLLKQTLVKRTPALIVHGKVPWNVGPSLWNV
jgi:hypothetical protein